MASLVVESWIWWACVIMVAASRFISRRMTLGSFLRFQTDDYMMLVLLCFYTTFLVSINIVANSQSNLLPPGFDITTLTEAEINRREYGSKLILVVEQCQCVTIWGAKLCLLILYLRLTSLRWQNIAIRVLAGYVVVSFVVMEILYFAVWCRPFHQYWAVPTNSIQCSAATNHLITNSVFNLSSDVIMLAIGLPIFLKMKLPWRKKIPLVGIFSLGVFVILAAILNKVYSFTEPFGALWTYWYVRESSTALLVANLPFVWKFWRKVSGFKTSVAGSDSNTKPATHFSVQGEGRRRDSAPDTHLESRWPEWEDKDDAALEADLRRFGTGPVSRGLTLAEFLRDDPGPSDPEPDHDRDDENGPGHSPPQRAVVNDGPAHATVRRESNPSSPPSSALPSIEGSWSASSFV